ncbi:MAG: PAQR family membrane homeostasis protein TrhA [Chloroflexota bacterium]
MRETAQHRPPPSANAKPLLRGWLHAGAVAPAVALTIALGLASYGSWPLFFAVLVFGLSMIQLYTVSAIYHVGGWQGRRHTVWRAVDHANIPVLIAGTYTPICVAVLTGWVRTGILATVWGLALAGVAGAIFSLRFPRWLYVALYVAMGWLAILSMPQLLAAWPWQPIALMLGGGLLYTTGAIVYALRRPNPWPRVFGFHEIFHVFVILGSATFAAVIWLWVVGP